MVKLIKKKALSANYCKEQSRLIKKYRRPRDQSSIMAPQIKQTIEYGRPSIFSNLPYSSSIGQDASNKLLNRSKMDLLRLKHHQHHQKIDLKHSSSSGSVLKYFSSSSNNNNKKKNRPDELFNKLKRKISSSDNSSSKQISSSDQNENSSKLVSINSNTNNNNNNTGDIKYMNLSNIPKEIRLETIQKFNEQSQSNLDMDTLNNQFKVMNNSTTNVLNNSSHELLPSSNQEVVQQDENTAKNSASPNQTSNAINKSLEIHNSNTNNTNTPTNNNNIIKIEDNAYNEPFNANSKRIFQTSMLKDKGFFTHYMIWKYIEDLPESWITEDLTNMATMDAIEQRYTNDPSGLSNTCMPDFSNSQKNDPINQKGIKRMLDSTTESENSSEISSSYYIKHLNSHQQQQQLQNPAHNKNNQLNKTSTKSTADKKTIESSQKYLEEKMDALITSNLVQSKQNQTNITPSKTINEEDNTPTHTNVMISIFKKTSSYSSKSHSKIVLIDENDNDDDETTKMNMTDVLITTENSTTAVVGAAATQNATQPVNVATTATTNLKTLSQNQNNTLNLSLINQASLNNNLPQIYNKNAQNSQNQTANQQNSVQQTNFGLFSPKNTNITPIDLNSGLANITISPTNQQINAQHAALIAPQSSASILVSASISNNLNNFPTQPKASNESSSKDSTIRLTKEVLAKHTLDQDEIYTRDIMKSFKAVPLKKMSDYPTNICAQAPNIYSRNEYEPNPKRSRLFSADLENIANTKQQITAVGVAQKAMSTTSTSNINPNLLSNNNMSNPDLENNIGPYACNINDFDFDDPQQYHDIYAKKLELDSYRNNLAEQSASNHNIMANLISDSKVNLDNSSLFDKSESKQVNQQQQQQQNNSITQQENDNKIMHAILAENRKEINEEEEDEVDHSLHRAHHHQVHRHHLHKDNNTSSNMNTTTSNSNPSQITKSNSTSVVSTQNNDDILKFWKRCIKYGSAIAKNLKESDNLIRSIKNARPSHQTHHTAISTESEWNEFADDEMDKSIQSHTNSNNNNNVIASNSNSGTNQNSSSSNSNSNENINKKDCSEEKCMIFEYKKRLKMKLYIVANLLGINTDLGLDDGSIDSNKTDILNGYIKKVIFKSFQLDFRI
jgi:hypothetical protein